MLRRKLQVLVPAFLPVPLLWLQSPEPAQSGRCPVTSDGQHIRTSGVERKNGQLVVYYYCSACGVRL